MKIGWSSIVQVRIIIKNKWLLLANRCNAPTPSSLGVSFSVGTRAPCLPLFENEFSRAGETAHRLRVLAAPAEDQGLVPSIQVRQLTAYTTSCKGSDALSWPPRVPAHTHLETRFTFKNEF